ncbi:MAG: hypothetical protein ACREF9_19805, partial [Opitutaceae bacterium]
TLRDAKMFPDIPWAEAHGYGRTSLRESQCIRRICGPSAALGQAEEQRETGTANEGHFPHAVIIGLVSDGSTPSQV